VNAPTPPLGAALRALRRPWLLAAAVVVLWAASGIYSVDRAEHGVVLTFGRVTADRVPPGLHYRLPWPVTRVIRVDTSTVHTMSVGFRIRDMVMGVPTPPEQSRFLTGDTNIVELRMVVLYRAADPAAYRLVADLPDELVRRAGEAVLTDLVGHEGVEVLTSGRGSLVSRSQVGIQQLLDAWECGIVVTSVSFEGMDPPREVVDAFHDVQSAKADEARMKEEADAYANAILPEARGEAARLLSEAEAYRESRLGRARGWASRFGELADAYATAPRETRSRLYLETAEQALARGELVIVHPGDGGEQQRTVLVRDGSSTR